MKRLAVICDRQAWLDFVFEYIFSGWNLALEPFLSSPGDEADFYLVYGDCDRIPEPALVIPRDRQGAAEFEKSGTSVRFDSDLLASLCDVLSCKRELELENADKSIESLAARLGAPAAELKQPAAGRLLRKLEEAFLALGAETGSRPLWPEGKDFAIALTHDIDTLRRSPLMLAKQTRHCLFRSLRALKQARPGRACGECAQLLAKLFGPGDYLNIKTILELEAQHGLTSTFNFMHLLPENSGSREERLYNVEYRLDREESLSEALRMIKDAGSEIALHGSYNSYRDAELLKAEADALEKTSGIRPLGSRQHFLRYSQRDTPDCQAAAGLAYDSSLGFRDCNAFRSASALPHFHFSRARQERIDLLQIPLLIMDGVMFDREFSHLDEAWQDVEKLLNTLRDYRGGCSIVWHNHGFSEKAFPGWAEAYRRILNWAKENKGWMGPCRELNQWWRNERVSSLS